MAEKTAVQEEPIIAWRLWRVKKIKVAKFSFRSSYEIRHWPPAIADMVQGIRADHAYLLTSLVMSAHWPPRSPQVAQCIWDDEKCRGFISEECSCGIYGIAQRVSVFQLLRSLLEREYDHETNAQWSDIDHVQPVYAIGRVSLWDKVLEGEEGYRAAMAYPFDLMLVNGTEEIAAALRNLYQVDVGLIDLTA